MKINRRWLAIAPLVAAAVVALVATSTGGARQSKGAAGSITVWVDAVRLPAAKAYVKAHKNVQVKIVTYDGDANGATTLQAKIQLWNRTNSGWPDVIFSQQANDPVWMAQDPFNYAATISDLMPDSVLSGWPATSTAQCTVDGRQVCVQDNIAQVVLWVNQKQMDAFGYTVPTTWQEWAALGAKVATEHPGYVIGNIGESFSHWIYLWGNQCPLSGVDGNTVTINPTDEHCTEMADLLDPLIKNGTVPPLSVFTPDFAKQYGGDGDKVLMMPGPSWYSTSVFGDTLHIPAGEMTAANALSWDGETPVTTGQVGGGPWIISKHAKDSKAAADFVTYATTEFNPTGKDARGGYPAYKPLADAWLEGMAANPYFAADPTPALKEAADKVWGGWGLVTYPDQPVWSDSVVSKLVAGDSLSSLLQPFGEALANAAKAAGYDVASN